MGRGAFEVKGKGKAEGFDGSVIALNETVFSKVAARLLLLLCLRPK